MFCFAKTKNRNRGFQLLRGPRKYKTARELTRDDQIEAPTKNIFSCVNCCSFFGPRGVSSQQNPSRLPGSPFPHREKNREPHLACQEVGRLLVGFLKWRTHAATGFYTTLRCLKVPTGARYIFNTINITGTYNTTQRTWVTTQVTSPSLLLASTSSSPLSSGNDNTGTAPTF